MSAAGPPEGQSLPSGAAQRLQPQAWGTPLRRRAKARVRPLGGSAAAALANEAASVGTPITTTAFDDVRSAAICAFHDADLAHDAHGGDAPAAVAAGAWPWIER